MLKFVLCIPVFHHHDRLYKKRPESTSFIVVDRHRSLFPSASSLTSEQ